MKEYNKENIAISWDKDTCIHAALCAKGLPSVFKPRESPWIQTDGASKKEIIDQVDRCPSGALKYRSIKAE
ncbi:MAG: (4Fe-4S)-binding protein [Flavobacteriales bacterium]|nr:(4Fe-4S)-binding protein [Flavobacteriales bacterium]